MDRTLIFMRHHLFLFISLIGLQLHALKEAPVSNPIIFSDTKHEIFIGNSSWILEDATNKHTIKNVITSTAFIPCNKNVPNLGISSSSFWLKFDIKNISDQENLLIEIANPLLDEIEFYTILPNGNMSIERMGEYQKFHTRKYEHPSYIFDLKIPKNATHRYFFRFMCHEDISLPIKLGAPLTTMHSIRIKDLLFGLYAGIMIVMFLYNAFIYITIKEKSYLFYIIYILAVTLTQSCIQGYTFQFLWYDSPWFAQKSIIFLGSFVGISAGEFVKAFLDTKNNLPKLTKALNIFYVSYIVCIILSFLGINSMQLINVTALLLSVFILIIAIILARRGNRSAGFFLVAWITFLIGVIVYALKSSGILPYNDFTIYTMPAGSAIEAILLSFALADRINILKRQKEASQAATLIALQENKKLITEQNIVLEEKVQERTIELNHTNAELNATLSDLIDTQTQLVNAEKMASLGQLTAGIAHEINNPINFVSANVKPLTLDIEDILGLIKKYEEIPLNETSALKLKEIDDFRKQIDFEYLKKEMSELLSGIEDGAKRTAEIVSGLKNFSRLDENDLKLANINEGIKSTLILLKSSVPDDLKVITDLGNIPAIECFPGKLNQVFMNLCNNAIYAINKNKTGLKQLRIKTYELNDHIFISIEDTGIGMTPEVKAKIFEPFYTTKDVGEGTGLGLAIVFKIIESHHGKIEIESEYGIGTKILIILNKQISQSNH